MTSEDLKWEKQCSGADGSKAKLLVMLSVIMLTDNTSCRIISAMSPEIQEWSHKSRSRINNLYLLTRTYQVAPDAAATAPKTNP